MNKMFPVLGYQTMLDIDSVLIRCGITRHCCNTPNCGTTKRYLDIRNTILDIIKNEVDAARKQVRKGK